MKEFGDAHLGQWLYRKFGAEMDKEFGGVHLGQWHFGWS